MGRPDYVGRWAGLRLPALPALIAGRDEVLAIYEATGTKAELVLLHALEPRRGIGTALVTALVVRLAQAGIRELWLTTTNDNLDALRFYQRRGFRLMEVRPCMLDEYRRRKPGIPEIGDYDIPMRDELRLVRDYRSLADPLTLKPSGSEIC